MSVANAAAAAAAAAAPDGFFTQENAQHLTTILARFFKERLQITLMDALPEPELRGLLSRTMRSSLSEVPAGTPLDRLNRLVLTKVKNELTQRLNDPPREPLLLESVERSVEEGTGPGAGMGTSTGAVMGTANTGAETDPANAANAIDADEAAFFQQLQDLQVTRQRTITAPSSAPLLTQRSPVPFSSSPAPSSATTAAAISAATIAIPRREWILSSAHRPWTYSRPRATFPWSGPTTGSKESGTTLRLARVLIPSKGVVQTHPLLIVRIDGPGSATTQVVATLERTVGPWALYSPASLALGVMWAIALPWTVRLLGTEGEPLPLGMDGASFQKVEIYPPSEAVFSLEDGTDGAREFDRGDRIEVHVNTTASTLVFQAIVLQGTLRTVHVDLTTADQVLDMTELQKGSGVLLNHSRQATLVLETSGGVGTTL